MSKFERVNIEQGGGGLCYNLSLTGPRILSLIVPSGLLVSRRLVPYWISVENTTDKACQYG